MKLKFLIVVIVIAYTSVGCSGDAVDLPSITIINSSFSDGGSEIINYDIYGNISKEEVLKINGLYEMESSGEVVYFPSNSNKYIGCYQNGELDVLETEYRSFDSKAKGKSLYTISGIDLEKGILEEYISGEKKNELILDGFLMKMEIDDEYIYIRSDLIDVENDVIESVLYCVNKNNFELERIVKLNDIEQCMALSKINDVVWIGNIFHDTKNILLSSEDEVVKVDLSEYSNKLTETVDFIFANETIYHIDRSGCIIALSNTGDILYVRMVIADGKIISSTYYENSFYFLIKTSDKLRTYKVVVYDGNLENILHEFEAKYNPNGSVFPKDLKVGLSW